MANRLNQGPFPQYPPDAVIPTDDVVMSTTASEDAVPNYGKGLVTYITADSGTEEIKSDNIPQAIEDLVSISFEPAALYPSNLEGSTAPTRTPGAARLSEARSSNWRRRATSGSDCAFKCVLQTTNTKPPSRILSLAKVPKVDLVQSDPESAAAGKRFLDNPHSRYQPRYDHPFFQQAFKELVGLLAAEFDGNPLIEFIDTFMYGFWGEGHTSPWQQSFP